MTYRNRVNIESSIPGDFVLVRPSKRCITHLADLDIHLTGDGLFLVTGIHGPINQSRSVEYICGNQYAVGYGYNFITFADAYTVIVDIIKPEDSDKLDKIMSRL